MSFLRESFQHRRIDPRLQWFCEPRRWSVDVERQCLRVETDENSDFWQKTHYGFEADNGHFLRAVVAEDFRLSTHVRFAFANQYDQAGLMVRISPHCWLKTSVEYESEGPSQLGAVVTHAGYSDWSTQPFPREASEGWFRLTRQGSDYTAEASENGKIWHQIRLAHLEEDAGSDIQAGLYACSPKGKGFVAEFDFLFIEPTPES